MKKIICLILIAFLFSCGKDGALGPQGERGERGEKGEKGDQGIAGVDGSTLLYGAVDPKISDGKVGDFYFNTSKITMFGPKSATGWGVGSNIKGSDGKDGTDGKEGGKILRGTVKPDTTIGDIGDYFFDTQIGNFYGPKKLIEYDYGDGYYVKYLDWGTPINLRPTKPQNVKLYLLKPEFKNSVKLNGLDVEALSDKKDFSEPYWSTFLEFFYHERQANISYPSEIFLWNWNQLWTDQIQVKDIVLPSGKLLKNVKLTMILEKPSPIEANYKVSFKLNATMPDTDISEISGYLFDIMIRVYYYSV